MTLVLLAALLSAQAPGSAAAPAAAATPAAAWGLVVVMSPAAEDEVTRNAMARITGELSAAPFRIAREAVDPAGDVMLQVETAGRALDPLAAFAIVPDSAGGTGNVEVWVSNRITHRTTVERVQVRAGDVDGAAAHLAVEAVELVRASMPGLWPGASKPPVVETPRPAPLEARFQVGVGVSVFQPLDTSASPAFPAFLAPALSVGYGRNSATRVRLTLMGLGPGSDVTAPDGSGGARLEHAAAELALVHAFRVGKTIQPLLSLGVGGERLTAQGTGAPAARVSRETAWSALAAVGAGGLLALGSHLAFIAEAQVLYLYPDTRIEVSHMYVAHVDRLTLNVEVGLLATF